MNKRSLAIVTVILVSLSLGCSLIDKFKPANSSPANTANGTSTSATPDSGPSADNGPLVSPGTDPRSEIKAASTRFMSLPYFTAHMTADGEQTMDIVLEYVKPDRYHMTNKMGTTTLETIVVGKDTFLKLGGSWHKMPGSAGANIPAMRDMFTEEGMKKLQDVKYVGEDPVDGVPAYKYSYQSSVGDSGTQPFTSSVWVSKATGLPAKIVVDYTGGKLRSATIVYDTKSPVSIEPPQ